MKENTHTITSHFAFGEHWDELPEYTDYVPEQYENWQEVKEQFYASGRYNKDNPLPVNIKKDNIVIVVYVYGFKVPETPMVIALDIDVATRGRVVLCKIISTKALIAIAW
ncbi:MAG TPA: hypothetical protein PKC87_04170 [Candidatus Absconditabacterales bacterium]|nr:hypothetical protein [Candidatus Absconditabacterales bacterium]